MAFLAWLECQQTLVGDHQRTRRDDELRRGIDIVAERRFCTVDIAGLQRLQELVVMTDRLHEPRVVIDDQARFQSFGSGA